MAKENPRVTELLGGAGDAATLAWLHQGVGVLSALADVDLAVAAAVALKKPALLLAAQDHGDKASRKAAASGLHKLRSAGVDVPAPVVVARAFSLEKEEVEVLLRAYVGVPDDNGDLEVLLTAATAEGSAAMGLVLGGRTGVRDVKVSFINRSAIRDVWRSAERFRRAEVPFSAGLHYAEAFGAEHPDWRHFVKLLPAELLESARTLDPLATRLPGQPDEPPTLTRWMPNPDLLEERALNRAMPLVMNAVGSEAHIDDDARRAAMDAIMLDAADAALTDEARAALVKHLELVRAMLWLSGWDRHHAMFGEILADVAGGAKGRGIASIEACVKLHLAQSVMQALQGGDAEPEL